MPPAPALSTTLRGRRRRHPVFADRSTGHRRDGGRASHSNRFSPRSPGLPADKAAAPHAPRRRKIRDFILAALDWSLTVALVVFAATLPALFIRQFGYFILASVAIGMLVLPIVVLMAFRSFYSPSTFESLEWQQFQISRAIVLQLAIIIGSLAIGFVHARSRTFALVVVSMAGAGLLTFAAWIFWPLNFVAHLSDHEQVAPRNEWPDAKAIRWNWNSRKTHDSPLSFAEAGINDVDYQCITGWCLPEGLPPPWYASPGAVQATLRSAKASVVRQSYFAYPINPYGLFKVWKSPTPSGMDSPIFSVELIRYAILPEQKISGLANLTGTVNVNMMRPVLAAELPLREGSSVTIGRRRYSIEEVQFSGGEVEVKWNTELARLRLRGDVPGWSDWHPMFFALWNTKLQQAAMINGKGGSRDVRAPYSFLQSYVSYIRPDPSGASNRNMTEAWLADAQCRLITAERGGSLKVPFDFPSIPLPK
jgi:hypothetical protein